MNDSTSIRKLHNYCKAIGQDLTVDVGYVHLICSQKWLLLSSLSVSQASTITAKDIAT